MLALAHHIQWAIDDGRLANRATISRKLGLTRARVTQLLNLVLLAPDIQDEILGLEAVDGAEPIRERGLREVVKEVEWGEQRMRWRAARPSPA
jgi:hypothetical protein